MKVEKCQNCDTASGCADAEEQTAQLGHPGGPWPASQGRGLPCEQGGQRSRRRVRAGRLREVQVLLTCNQSAAAKQLLIGGADSADSGAQTWALASGCGSAAANLAQGSAAGEHGQGGGRAGWREG